MNEIISFDTEALAGIKPKYQPYSLVPEDAEILKQKAVPFPFDGTEKEVSGRLIATLEASKALGVAAPQCGIPYRVFVMGAEGQYYTIFNPEIIEVSKETVAMEEGCLSFAFLVLNVVRPKSVTVKYTDENKNEKTFTLEGLSARIFLHEYDHLEGITFNKVAKPLALKMGLKKREKQFKRYAKHLISQSRIENEKSR